MENSEKHEKSSVSEQKSVSEAPYIPPFPASPTIQQGYTQQGYTLAAIAPTIPHHVWTKENWETFLKLLKESGDRDQSNNMKYAEMFNDQNKRENKLVWLYSLSGLLILAFG